MLVVSRKRGQKVAVTVGDTVITVVLTEIGRDGNSVRLGIEAPPEVAIQRIEKDEQGNEYKVEKKGDK